MQLRVEQTFFLFVSFYNPSQLSPSSCLELLIKRVHSRNVKEYKDEIRSTFGVLSSPFFRVIKSGRKYRPFCKEIIFFLPILNDSISHFRI